MMKDFKFKIIQWLPKEAEVLFVLLKLIPLVLYSFVKAAILNLIPRQYRHRKDISGQTVLITGAGNGIGRQLAITFSKCSVNLVLLDLDKVGLKHTEELLDPSSKSFLYECDITNRLKVYEIAKEIKASVGKVGILVNNAGVVCGKKFLELPDEKIQKTIEVNTLAHFWMLKAFLPDMMDTKKGHIVCIASMAAVCGFPRLTEYCASKFGAVGFMESLIWELESERLDGIKVTMVCPNIIQTGLFKGTKQALSLYLTPEYVAEEVLQGVLEEKQLMMLPCWLYFIILLKWTMPQVAVRDFFRNTGLLNFMDDFQGRRPSAEMNGCRGSRSTKTEE